MPFFYIDLIFDSFHLFAAWPDCYSLVSSILICVLGVQKNGWLLIEATLRSRYVPQMSVARKSIIPVALSSHGTMVPMVSSLVPAGFPSPAADDLEDEIDPIAWVVRHPSATFWWRVSGDSLIDEGIHDGDLIAVDRAGKRRIGRIVLALIDGEITVKKLARRDGRYWLDPKSKGREFTPILVTENTEIWGVIAGVVRRYSVD